MPAVEIAQIEAYVRETMASARVPDLLIGHGYPHVDRVRRWAVCIAGEEGYKRLDLVEAAALLHDIGLAYVEERSQHGQVGAEVAAGYLREQGLFPEAEIEVIAEAVRCHSAPEGGGGALGDILRDADKLDAFGAVGIVRAFTSKYGKPAYDPRNVKGETWGLTIWDFERRFAEGQGIGPTILDQVNFQISLAGDMRTESGQRLAAPLVAFMRTFLHELAWEIEGQASLRTY